MRLSTLLVRLLVVILGIILVALLVVYVIAPIVRGVGTVFCDIGIGCGSPSVPQITKFQSSTNTVAAPGDTVTLTWNTNGANAGTPVTINGKAETASSGQDSFPVTQNPTGFTLVATNANGKSSQKSLNVGISGTAAAPSTTPAVTGTQAPTGIQIVSFTSSPNPAKAGDMVTVSWEVTGVSGVLVNGVQEPAKGSLQEQLNAAKTYTLLAGTSAENVKTQSLTVNVSSASQPAAPTVAAAPSAAPTVAPTAAPTAAPVQPAPTSAPSQQGQAPAAPVTQPTAPPSAGASQAYVWPTSGAPACKPIRTGGPTPIMTLVRDANGKPAVKCQAANLTTPLIAYTGSDDRLIKPGYSYSTVAGMICSGDDALDGVQYFRGGDIGAVTAVVIATTKDHTNVTGFSGDCKSYGVDPIQSLMDEATAKLKAPGLDGTRQYQFDQVEIFSDAQ